MPNEELSQKKCVPCEGGVPPLKGNDLQELSQKLDSSWDLVDERYLHKTYKFKNFRKALDFTNQVGEIAEEQGHHPDIELSWGKVGIKLLTHKIDGLTESDFIMAAKCDAAYKGAE